MTEPKKAVEGKQAGNPPSGAKKPTAGSVQQKKPAAPRAQVKSSGSKSHAKTTTSAPKQGNTSSDSAKLKENTARAEALENRNILLPEEKDTSTSATEPTDVTGVIIPNDNQEMNIIKPSPERLIESKENIGHRNSEGKHKKKDKVKLLKIEDDSGKTEIHEAGKPMKEKATLQQKAVKAEKKVNKLKKKVHKAEKKEVKKSKLRLLKEKLTKAFAKWQRRKKKLEKTDE